jgi:hypothetical protein
MSKKSIFVNPTKASDKLKYFGWFWFYYNLIFLTWTKSNNVVLSFGIIQNDFPIPCFNQCSDKSNVQIFICFTASFSNVGKTNFVKVIKELKKEGYKKKKENYLHWPNMLLIRDLFVCMYSK